MRLVTPDQPELACIDVLGDRHSEHLAALERQLGLEPETIERLATVGLLKNTESLEPTSLPAVRLAMTGLADEPERVTDRGRTSLSLPWRLEVDILAMGRDPVDAMQRVRWLAMTVAECLLQRLPRRSDPVERLDLDGCDLETISDSGHNLGHAELQFTVLLADALTVTGGLPADTGEHEPGTPGGPPATPYDPLEPWPDGLDVELDIDRSPLTD